MMKKNTRYAIPTETPNARTQNLDRMTPRQIARKINAEDFNAARAVKTAAPAISQAIERAAQTFLTGHTIVFIGAGTSGRLGVLEAAECVPTFGTDPKQIVGLIAGGESAMFRAKEGAEDDDAQGARDAAAAAAKEDFVIGLTASGVTPYVLGALKKAKQRKAHTALITCNPQADGRHADILICLPTGPEALCGSTRMKAGTATKMALNALTTGAMALCGKMYGNLMADVRPTNQKLVSRAKRLIGQIARTDEKTAAKLFKLSGGNVKTAVVMHVRKTTKAEAENLLKQAQGFLHKIID